MKLLNEQENLKESTDPVTVEDLRDRQVWIHPNSINSKTLEMDELFDLTYNGIMVNNEAFYNEEYPCNIWDAGIEIENNSLVISGSGGPSGYGSARCEFPLNRGSFLKTVQTKDFLFIEPKKGDEEAIAALLNAADWGVHE